MRREFWSIRSAGDSRSFESAPFAYIRFEGPGDPVRNQLFRDVFSDEAVTILREQIEDGVIFENRDKP